MYVVFDCETGWSSEDMRFPNWIEARGYMTNMNERGYNMDMRRED